MESYETQPQEQHLFDDNQYHLVQASSGKRFANYIIDIIVFYVILFIVGIFLAYVSPDALSSFADNDSAGFNILDRLLSLVLYGIYMFITEAIFKGKSLGKLITGTRAVKEDGSPVTINEALLRGLSRMVPFEAFSALGNPSYPWHDKWAKTYVIDEKESRYPV